MRATIRCGTVMAAALKARDLGWNTRAMEERLASYKGGKAWQGDLFAP